MTFADFQQLCDQAVSTAQSVSSPCPIVVGDEAETQSTIGDTLFHQVVIFKMKPDPATLQAIYASVRFTFDSQKNETVISPLTTGV